MPNVSPEQWQEWQKNSVTLEVMEQVRSRIEEAKDQLVGPSNDRDFDQFVKGMIRGFTEVLEVQLDLTTEEEWDDEVQAGDAGPSGNY